MGQDTRKTQRIRPSSQKGRQLARLQRDWPNWTSAHELRNPDGKGEILQQNARLWELRHVHGYDIESREEWINGICHSAYRLRHAQPVLPAPRIATASPSSDSLFADLTERQHRDDG
jgi:hypothetical protein